MGRPPATSTDNFRSTSGAGSEASSTLPGTLGHLLARTRHGRSRSASSGPTIPTGCSRRRRPEAHDDHLAKGVDRRARRARPAARADLGALRAVRRRARGHARRRPPRRGCAPRGLRLALAARGVARQPLLGNPPRGTTIRCAVGSRSRLPRGGIRSRRPRQELATVGGHDAEGARARTATSARAEPCCACPPADDPRIPSCNPTHPLLPTRAAHPATPCSRLCHATHRPLPRHAPAPARPRRRLCQGTKPPLPRQAAAAAKARTGRCDVVHPPLPRHARALAGLRSTPCAPCSTPCKGFQPPLHAFR